MITLEEYLKAPCGTLSIPYWKWSSMSLPNNIRIMHNRECENEDMEKGEQYFRLKHDLQKLPALAIGGCEIATAEQEDFKDICNVINQCYTDVNMTMQKLQKLTVTPVYDPSLWIVARKRSGGRIIGCAIGDLDCICREGILEWVQVLPEYRRQGIGTLMVSTLLERMSGKASFATVSGRVDNRTNPEKLYRKCGFSGDDIWHIVRT